MENIEINKPGFFHLCTELKKEKEVDDIANKEYWIKRQNTFLSILERHNIPNPQKLAVKNAVGVFMYQIPGKQYQTKCYFENLLEETDCQQINTIANFLYVLRELKIQNEDTDEYSCQISTWEKKLQVCHTDALCEARGLCERGYFCDYQFDGHIQNLSQSKLAKVLYETGIERGSVGGMSQMELYVWKFYLLDTIRKVFSFTYTERGVSQENVLATFKEMVEAVEDFSAISMEQCDFYRSRSVVDTVLHITCHEDAIANLPTFKSECKSSKYGELWQDRKRSMEKALDMSKYDYHVPAKIARAYSKQGNYKEVFKYTDMSLFLESQGDISAYNTRLIAYAKMSRDYQYQANKKDLATECLKKAYQDGKIMENIYMPFAAAAEMASVCFHLAVEKNKGWWIVPEEKMGYMDEAIAYNKRSINAAPGKQYARAECQLSRCLWIINHFEESFIALRRALELSESKQFVNNFKCLLDRYCKLFQNSSLPEDIKLRAATHAITDFENVWDKITVESEFSPEIQAELVIFTKRLARQDHYLNAILDGFSQKQSGAALMFFYAYCRLIRNTPQMPEWIHEYCFRVLKC